MSRGTCAVIHLDNIRHNLQVARRHAPHSRIWAVVKANAYGHGLLPVAQMLAAEADGLAVATLDEALTLRAAGITSPVLLLEGVVSMAQTQTALDADLELVVHTMDQRHWLAEASVQQAVRVWLKVDTGMRRLGFMPAEAGAEYAHLQALPQVATVSFMTHYARADDPAHAMTPQQYDCLHSVMPPGCEASLANSGGVLFWPGRQGDWVRPGIMLYGATPAPEQSRDSLGLRAGMTLHAPIIALRDLAPGDTVGYGGGFSTDRPLRLATVAMGYADGYPRHAPNDTPVAINGIRCRLVGRVSMDMLTVDVTGLQDIGPGTPVELWGPYVAVDEVAQAAGTIGYELLAGLALRGRYDYVTEQCS